MVRTEALKRLRARTENDGAIVLPPRAVTRARKRFLRKTQDYVDSQRNLIEATHPQHYKVAIFGSAKLGPETEEYAFTEALAHALVSRLGVDIVDGAGPGIMEAAHAGGDRAKRDAEEQGMKLRSRNHGMTLSSFKETPDPRIDQRTEHTLFSTRIDHFLAEANAVYIAPGGIGSLTELAIVEQLVQVKHLEPDFPVILHPWWKDIVEFLKDKMYYKQVEQGKPPMIKEEDFDGIIFSDDIPTIVDMISANHDTWQTEMRSKVVKPPVSKLPTHYINEAARKVKVFSRKSRVPQ